MDKFSRTITKTKKVVFSLLLFSVIGGIFMPLSLKAESIPGVSDAEGVYNPLGLSYDDCMWDAIYYIKNFSGCNALIGETWNAAHPDFWGVAAGTKDVEDVVVDQFSGPLGTAVVNLMTGFGSFIYDAGATFLEYCNLIYSKVASELIKGDNWTITNGENDISAKAFLPSYNTAKRWAGMIIVVALLMIAIAYILSLDQYKKLLVPLLITAILINFSVVLVGFMIDLSNVLVKDFLGDAGVGTSIGDNLKLTTRGIQGALVNEIELSDDPNKSVEITEEIKKASLYIAQSFISFIVLVVVGIALLLMAILFIVRYAYLAFLFIVSPLAFAIRVFPAEVIKKGFNKWWELFFQWCFAGVIAAFFLKLGIESFTNGMIAVFGPDFNTALKDIPAQKTQLGTVIVIAIVALVFIFLGLKMAWKSAGPAAKMLIGGIASVAALGVGAVGLSASMAGKTMGAAGSMVPGSGKIKEGANWLTDNARYQFTRAGEGLGLVRAGTANATKSQRQEERMKPYKELAKRETDDDVVAQRAMYGKTAEERAAYTERLTEMKKLNKIQGSTPEETKRLRIAAQTNAKKFGIDTSKFAEADYRYAEFDKKTMDRIKSRISAKNPGLTGSALEAEAKKLAIREQLETNLSTMSGEKIRNIDKEHLTSSLFTSRAMNPSTVRKFQTADQSTLSVIKGLKGSIRAKINSTSNPAEKKRLENIMLEIRRLPGGGSGSPPPSPSPSPAPSPAGSDTLRNKTGGALRQTGTTAKNLLEDTTELAGDTIRTTGDYAGGAVRETGKLGGKVVEKTGEVTGEGVKKGSKVAGEGLDAAGQSVGQSGRAAGAGLMGAGPLGVVAGGALAAASTVAEVGLRGTGKATEIGGQVAGEGVKIAGKVGGKTLEETGKIGEKAVEGAANVTAKTVETSGKITGETVEGVGNIAGATIDEESVTDAVKDTVSDVGRETISGAGAIGKEAIRGTAKTAWQGTKGVGAVGVRSATAGAESVSGAITGKPEVGQGMASVTDKIPTSNEGALSTSGSPKKESISPKDYELLGVSPNASPEEIRKAYKNLAKEQHPDMGGSSEEFKKVTGAYESLMNRDTNTRDESESGAGAQGNIERQQRRISSNQEQPIEEAVNQSPKEELEESYSMPTRKPISGEAERIQVEGGLNNRREAMLRELNEKTGSSFPLTEEGYNEVGRSEGIMDKIAESTGEDKEAIQKRFLSISRDKEEGADQVPQSEEESYSMPTRKPISGEAERIQVSKDDSTEEESIDKKEEEQQIETETVQTEEKPEKKPGLFGRIGRALGAATGATTGAAVGGTIGAAKGIYRGARAGASKTPGGVIGKTIGGTLGAVGGAVGGTAVGAYKGTVKGGSLGIKSAKAMEKSPGVIGSTVGGITGGVRGAIQGAKAGIAEAEEEGGGIISKTRAGTSRAIERARRGIRAGSYVGSRRASRIAKQTVDRAEGSIKSGVDRLKESSLGEGVSGIIDTTKQAGSKAIEIGRNAKRIAIDNPKNLAKEKTGTVKNYIQREINIGKRAGVDKKTSSDRKIPQEESLEKTPDDTKKDNSAREQRRQELIEKFAERRTSVADARVEIEDKIEKNPEISKEELDAFAKERMNSANLSSEEKELGNRLLEEFYGKRDSVSNFVGGYKKYGDEKEKNRQMIGDLLGKDIINGLSDEEIKNIKINKGPMQLTIEADLDTVQKLGPGTARAMQKIGKRVGGFAGERKGIAFNVIASDASGGDRITTHELQHTKNKLYRNQFEKMRLNEMAKMYKEAKDNNAPNAEDRLTLYLTELQHQGLNNAKDEITAMIRGGDNPKDILNELDETFFTKDNPYDYFGKYHGEPRETKVFKENPNLSKKIMEDNYRQKMVNAIKSIDDLMKSKNIDSKEAIALLGSDPMERWPRIVQRLTKK